MSQIQIVIKPKTSFAAMQWAEMLQFRELFWILAWKEIKVRYKQTVLGVLWVIFQPLTSMVIFTIFFGQLAKIPSSDLPYQLFVLCGLVYWNFFSNTLSQASNSIISNENIIKKVYFPRLILPLATVVTNLIDFAINLILLLLLGIFFGYFPSWRALYIIPFSIILVALSAGGLGLLLASLNVKYRDVRYILPFFIQGMLFLTPVIYPLSIVSPLHRIFLSINPLTTAIELTRSLFSESISLEPTLIGISIIGCGLLLLLGFFFFKRNEDFFADIV